MNLKLGNIKPKMASYFLKKILENLKKWRKFEVIK